MKTNYLIQRISLCANPDLERLVTLHNVGLSDKPGKCFIVSADTNLADGIMRCDLKRAEDFKQEGYKVRGEIKLETMDAMVKGDYFMMKIDIEGARTEWQAAVDAEAAGDLEAALDHYVNAESYYELWRDGEQQIERLKKAIAEKRKQGIEVYTDEEIEAAGFLPEE